MREIKFRGKRKDNDEWIYGDLLHFGKNTEILRDIPIGMNESIKVIPETVGQYTGLKDKNGKEIYEGDIVKFTEHFFKAEVVYWKNCFAFNSRNPDTINNPDALMYFEDCEVIGNIYENPDLLP